MSNALKHRNFRWLFGGQLTSNIGNSLFVLALFWYVQSSTHSPAKVAWLGFAMTIPSLAGFLTGAIVDIVDRRRLLWLTDSIRFLLVVGVTLMVAMHLVNLWFIAAVVCLVSIGGNLFWPASNAILPSLVPEEDLVSANGWLQGSGQFAQSFGALLGSIIIATVGVVVVFGFDALTFLVSVSTLLVLRIPSSSRTAVNLQSYRIGNWFKDTLEGLVTLWQWPMIRWILPGVALMNLAYAPFFVMTAAWSQEILHHGSFGYSMLVLAESLGNLTGGLSAASVQRRFPGILPWVFSMILTLAVAAFPWFPHLWSDFSALLVFGVGTGMINTLFLTLLQQRIPEQQLGRVFASIGTIFGAALPLGTALAGLAVGSFGLITLFWTAALAIVAAAAYLGSTITWHPDVRSEASLSVNR